MTATAATTAQRWLAALAGLYQVPDDFRVGYFDRAGAVELLHCGEEVFDELVAAGLGHTGAPGEERFDRYDLFNLALASGSGGSVPERAIAYALRWMNQDPESWITPIDWAFSVSVQCPHEACGADPVFTHTRLLPDLVGGEVRSWSVEPDGVREDEGRLRLDAPGPLSLAAELTTRGRPGTLVSPVLRGVVEDFRGAGYRWVRVPERLQWDYERMLAAGVAPCISASLFLAEQFEKAGYRAFARRGWLLGILDLAHSWVEVEDDDGVVKPVDLIAGWLSGYADRPHPRFAQAGIGSWLNRQLPAELAADGLMATHRCGGVESEPKRATIIRRTSGARKGAQ